jgi:hypothetical protein
MANDIDSTKRPRLLFHSDVPDAAKDDIQLLASAETSMDAALARLPRPMPWFVQPSVLFGPPRHDGD